MRSFKAILALSLLFQAGFSFASLKEVADKENAINQLSTAYYQYQATRDQLFLGDKGLIKRAEIYHSSIEAWLGKWQTWSNSRSGAIGDISRLTSEISAFVRDQNAAYFDAVGRKIEIADIHALIRTRLAQNKVDAATENLQPQKARLEELQKEMLAYSEAISLDSDRQAARMQEMVKVYSYDFFALKIKEKAVSEGIDTNSPIYTSSMNFIKAEMLGQPVIADLEKRSLIETNRMIRMEGYGLAKSIPAFAKACTDAKAGLNAAPVTSDQKSRLLNEASTICDSVQTRYQDTIQIYSAVDLIDAMHRRKVKSNRIHCLDNKAKARCDIYNRLAVIDSTVIRAYNPASLEALESEWKIFEGSIP